MTAGARSVVFSTCIGRGGFGEVYRATLCSGEAPPQQVAVKVLRQALDTDVNAVRRLRDEARLLSHVRHPNILSMHDLVNLEGRLALITEWVEGVDLAECLRARPALSLRATLEVVAQVAAALDAAWRSPGPDGTPLRIVHRDLKPTNVRVGHRGQVRLLDFGIAHFASPEREAKTASDLVVGSVPYMAPERFFEHHATPAADVYGLGCVLYEALTGERFQTNDVRQVARVALMPELYEAFMQERLLVLPDTSNAVRTLLQRSLAYSAERRPSAKQLAAQCEALLAVVTGPSLQAWIHRWPVDSLSSVTGPLEGRTLSEGPLRRSPRMHRMGAQVVLRGALTVDRIQDRVGGGLSSGGVEGRQEGGGASDARPRPTEPPRPGRFVPTGRATTVVGIGCLMLGTALMLTVPLIGATIGWLIQLN